MAFVANLASEKNPDYATFYIVLSVKGTKKNVRIKQIYGLHNSDYAVEIKRQCKVVLRDF